MRLSFRSFLEAEEAMYASHPAEIPLPQDVMMLCKLFGQAGRELLIVGGTPRDFMFHIHHNHPYKPKDIDLATEAPPDEVIRILNSPMAKKEGIKVFPKGESFGVISAVIHGEEYEIATFREDFYDAETGDGRRPDQVSFSTPAKDAQRRDLTFNALFYDPLKHEIRDYNHGQGFEDIKHKRVRFVGSPQDRIREDRLRLLRLLRFDARFNQGDITQRLDKDTLDAVDQYRHLPGISPERIANEFLTGLAKAISPRDYLRNYASLGMFEAVFPRLQINNKDIDRIDSRNPAPVLAWLLHNNDPITVKKALNSLKYSSDVFNRVAYLLELYDFQPQKIIQYLRQRDIWKQEKDISLGQAKRNILERDIIDFARMAGIEDKLRHFIGYQPIANAKDFAHLSGPALGNALKQAETDAYLKNKR